MGKRIGSLDRAGGCAHRSGWVPAHSRRCAAWAFPPSSSGGSSAPACSAASS